MSGQTGFETHAIHATVRFIKGYRYLDHCGEALIKLENILAEGWIPLESSPKGGNLKNDKLGMSVLFNADSLTVQQTEFISYEHYRDQTCKIYDTLWQTFEIERINVPVVKIVLQKGFNEGQTDEAARYMMDLNLVNPNEKIVALLGGQKNALDSTLVTVHELIYNNQPVQCRRRMEISVVRQEKQPPFDMRLLQRARLLPERQRQAMTALLQLKRQHPDIAPVAAQVDLENSLEAEFDAEGFDMPAFLEQSWNWAEKIRTDLPSFQRKK
jgi:hypothetical protein